jgi:segregation and condensation protein A
LTDSFPQSEEILNTSAPEAEPEPSIAIEPTPDSEPASAETTAEPAAEPEEVEVKGTGFSPYIPPANQSRALVPEGMQPETQPLPETVIEAESTVASEANPEAPAPSTTPLVLTPDPTAEQIAATKAEEKSAAKLAARQKMLDEGSEQSPFSVLVGQVYDGPLDLLLDLIRKQDIDIYDIPIAKITAQFLAYVNQLKSGDVDVAGEFIYTASLLIHIKSKMLLPRAATGPDGADEDPRRELVERLLEHERFKNAAQMLQQKQMLESASWTNPGSREFKNAEGTEPEIAADTVDLVRIFREILDRARQRPVFNLQEDSVTVGQMIQYLSRRLTMDDKPVALRRLLIHTRSERALIAMFLALLELVRLQAILLRQDLAFSEIFIKKHTGFDSVMSSDLINTQDDWR